ncbi:MAG: UDP-N-acetylmuramoyl-tripeptide--D-alanyl-D-alanine ligase [Prevotellaceae bacterium]|nr:UDP-N-acetylmuramoyl-tripeptide--D-alanyl-D-alanine ligase [Prevotellaceae bacterium]
MTSIPQLYQQFLACTGACTDSRKVLPNSMFFALRGEQFNGNTFALQALQQGAAWAVVDEDVDAGEARCIRVPSVLQVLQDLAALHRRELNIPIVAITGTNGKTTTKELASAVLARKLRVASTQGNLNNHIGVPLTLLGMDASVQLGVVEMGANHPLEIAALCRIAQPNAGLITNVGVAHLEGFGSLDGVKKTKGELYDYLAQHGGTAFCNSDSSDLLQMLRASGVQQVVSYGLRECGVQVDGSPSSSPFLRLQMGNGEAWQTQLVGSYNAANVLAAIALGRYYGVAEADIRHAVENYAPQNNRSQLLQTPANTIIVDAYNANPSSMEASIASFVQLKADNKFLILGDMLELGESSLSEHRRVVQQLQHHHLHDAMLVGEQFSQVASPHYATFADVDALNRHLAEHRIAGRVILIKGSHGVHLERVVEGL